MKSAEKQLREIQLALKYCDLDFNEILEDYREHLKDLKNRAKYQVKKEQPQKEIKKKSA